MKLFRVHPSLHACRLVSVLDAHPDVHMQGEFANANPCNGKENESERLPLVRDSLGKPGRSRVRGYKLGTNVINDPASPAMRQLWVCTLVVHASRSLARLARRDLCVLSTWAQKCWLLGGRCVHRVLLLLRLFCLTPQKKKKKKLDGRPRRRTRATCGCCACTAATLSTRPYPPRTRPR
jgi:hypothetical protein